MTENPYTDIIVQALGERGRVRTRFTGRSMQPALVEGMLIEVEKVGPAAVRTADIIFYKKDGQMVVHRVVRISREAGERIFVTKGDNQAYIDGDRVPEADLVGVVRAAFFEGAPQANALACNKIITLSYAALGRSTEFALRARGHCPRLVRLASRHLVGAFFLMFKKSIHVIYIGTRYGQLFLGRRKREFRGL